MSKYRGITTKKSYILKPVEPKRKLNEFTFGRTYLSQFNSEPVDV